MAQDSTRDRQRALPAAAASGRIVVLIDSAKQEYCIDTLATAIPQEAHKCIRDHLSCGTSTSVIKVKDFSPNYNTLHNVIIQ